MFADNYNSNEQSDSSLFTEDYRHRAESEIQRMIESPRQYEIIPVHKSENQGFLLFLERFNGLLQNF